jgi:hypothetical protein
MAAKHQFHQKLIWLFRKKKVEKSGFHKSNYKGILKQLNRRKIEKDVNQWHNVYPRLKNKIKGPSQMVI